MGAVGVNKNEQIARIMLAAAPRPHARLSGQFRVHGVMFEPSRVAADIPIGGLARDRGGSYDERRIETVTQ
ncbi:hypothetical protein [Bradyrhizobium icense]|nr:hypothetical protein [Bradyrhizobium icense]